MRSSRAPFTPVIAITLMTIACDVADDLSQSEIVYSRQVPTWFEDGWSFYDVSPDALAAVFGARFGRSLVSLGDASPSNDGLLRDGESAPDAFFADDGRLWRRHAAGWSVDGGEVSPLPVDAAPRFSPDGTRVAYYRGTAGSGPALFVGEPGRAAEVDLGEGLITGFGWAPDGSALYTMVFLDDGTSELHRVEADALATTLIRGDLDAGARFNSVAVTADGRRAYIALVGPDAPDAEARHDPNADRDLDIYSIDLEDGVLTPVVTTPGDDFHPLLRGDDLYWTHNEYEDEVVVLPVGGGDVRPIVTDGQIPSWSADGTEIAFTVGGWVLADWALNMDAWVVDVDEAGDRISEPEPLISGYHEDFTPAWSPDGRWLAYHSHRSATPVPHYFASGGTDDIYLREADAPMEAEIRLMDFGWEVGVADWDRTGTRLFFDSWERGGPSGVSHPWIATIDPETGRAVAMDRLELPEGFGGTVLAAWSPVADELAVVERIAGQDYAIWRMRPDGTGARRIVEYRASTYGGVDWTPDGARLVYGGLIDGRMQLFSVGSGGGEPVQLTAESEDVLQPQVSPNGEWIAASRLRHVKELGRIPIG
jgi:Tol biopolymer transport system component